jgi:peptidoglycan hydrolase-like protein with peptidoglycan-binding domain
MAKDVVAFPEILDVAPAAPGEANEDLTHVQNFLVRFGYLPEQVFQPGQLDDKTSEALGKFQEFNALPPTGGFDETTKDEMTTPRCAMPDASDGRIAFSTTCKWNKTELTFAFDTGSTDIPGEAEFDAVRAAFRTWASAIPLTFTEVASDQNPDIGIGWRPATDPDLSMVGTTLAHADFPPGCSFFSPDPHPKPVHFDETEVTWAVGASPGAFDVETVALHELGHILGLQHSTVPGAVMSPTVASNTLLRTLTADDIAGAQSLYGSVQPNVPPPFPGRLLKFPPLTRGQDVAAWQQRMNERGFSLVVDGLYGKNSKAACISFQQQQGLQADGIVGPITWDATFAAISSTAGT